MTSDRASSLLWMIVAVPFLYLAYIYPDLPAEVPIRFGRDGQPIAYGSKALLWLLPTVGPLLMAIIFSFVLPRATFERQPLKLWRMMVWTTGLMAALITYILWATVRGELVGMQFFYVLIGGLLVVTGNFMPVIPPNRWIGIRLPVTLRDEATWWRVHRFSGPLWVVGGAVVMGASLLVPAPAMIYVLLTTVVLLGVVSTVYAYR